MKSVDTSTKHVVGVEDVGMELDELVDDRRHRLGPSEHPLGHTRRARVHVRLGLKSSSSMRVRKPLSNAHLVRVDGPRVESGETIDDALQLCDRQSVGHVRRDAVAEREVLHDERACQECR